MANLKLPSLLLIFSVAVMLGFTACDTTNENNSTQTGKIEVKLTDAPANYEAVNIDIEKVLLHKSADAEVDTTESGEEDAEDGWITILEEPMEVDLLELTNGNDITLGSAELEEGRYSQLRFVLGDNNTITIDGQTEPLTTPSAQQSGLKLQLNTDIESGTTYTLLVDFDAARSIVEAGNSGKYILKPVLHAVNLAEAGSISGNVEPPVSEDDGFRTNVMAITGDDTLSTITSDNGDYMIMGLLPATYDVVFDPDSDMHSDTTVTGIEVTANEETVVDTVSFQ
ncbi:DUF4382 domain-containing protein [Fodinibius sediminis]|uniref:DUF4382 domain-containing protein n=1 Tax=Fodinibius sediminis TaxID=1214077 RepID=A0A521BX27_9BACT|nr:DUF4382 domain-containing protein [Fodinibius sediminis]SMO51762.1 protein of unknown function [Fodinibius sediminis]